jgi:hypothetical protein
VRTKCGAGPRAARDEVVLREEKAGEKEKVTSEPASFGAGGSRHPSCRVPRSGACRRPPSPSQCVVRSELFIGIFVAKSRTSSEASGPPDRAEDTAAATNSGVSPPPGAPGRAPSHPLP